MTPDPKQIQAMLREYHDMLYSQGSGCYAEDVEAQAAALDGMVVAPMEAMALLVKWYVANPGTKHQFIACVTPGATGDIPDAWETVRTMIAQAQEQDHE